MVFIHEISYWCYDYITTPAKGGALTYHVPKGKITRRPKECHEGQDSVKLEVVRSVVTGIKNLEVQKMEKQMTTMFCR